MINFDKEALCDLILADNAQILDLAATETQIFIVTESRNGLKRYTVEIEDITENDLKNGVRK